jgi:RNA polymerase sigma factor (sigma-70 family)
MNEQALGVAIGVRREADLDREFEARLAESATLAFRVAYGVLRRREDAQDVAQEAMAHAYRNFGKLQDRERFRSWLVRIAWRLAVNHRRAEERRVRRELAVSDARPSPSVEELIASRQFEARVWRAVDELPDRLRRVVTLTAMSGHDVREVARLLDVPEGTVKSRLHQARKALAERLRCLVTVTKRS